MSNNIFNFTLGYMPTKRRFFSGEDAKKYKEIIRKRIAELEPGIRIVDLEGLNEHGLLNSIEDASAAVKRFRSEGVDAVFVPHCNFGCEEAVCIPRNCRRLKSGEFR